MTEAADDPRPLENIAASYLDMEGVTAAALVSVDGLLVAAAGDGAGLEGVAAHAASTLASCLSLSREFDGASPRMIVLKLAGSDLVLAPLTEDLFLVLVADEGKLSAGAVSDLSL